MHWICSSTTSSTADSCVSQKQGLQSLIRIVWSELHISSTDNNRHSSAQRKSIQRVLWRTCIGYLQQPTVYTICVPPPGSSRILYFCYIKTSTPVCKRSPQLKLSRTIVQYKLPAGGLLWRGRPARPWFSPPTRRRAPPSNKCSSLVA